MDWYDYGFRNYDAQIGRFTQLDPLTWDYPELTNYQYASNDPILNIDLDGLEGFNAAFTGIGTAANQLGDVVVTTSPKKTVQTGSKTLSAAARIGLNAPKILRSSIPNPPKPPINVVHPNIVLPADNPAYLSPAPNYTPYEKQQHDEFVKQQNVKNGYNSNGRKPWLMKVAENKHFAGAANNLVLPTITLAGFAGGEGELADGMVLLEKGAALDKGEVTVYRVFGGDSKAEGFSWTPVNPNSVSDFRNLAGLPSGGASGFNNTAEFMIEGRVNSKNILRIHPAEPLDGNIGGLPEFKIDPKNITITKFKVLKP